MSRGAVVVACAALVFAVPAAATPKAFVEAKRLEPAASYVARKPVRVYCATSTRAWTYFAETQSSDGAIGLATPGGASAWLSDKVCVALDSTYGPSLGAGIEALTHEAIHLRGETDEAVTDCSAMHETPGVAVRYFHVKPGAPLRAMMAAVWDWHRKSAPAYQADC